MRAGRFDIYLASRKGTKPTSRPVRVTTTGNDVRSYPSLQAAADDFKVCRQAMYRLMRGEMPASISAAGIKLITWDDQ